jgi:hypothetical protein
MLVLAMMPAMAPQGSASRSGSTGPDLVLQRPVGFAKLVAGRGAGRGGIRESEFGPARAQVLVERAQVAGGQPAETGAFRHQSLHVWLGCQAEGQQQKGGDQAGAQQAA